MFCKNCGKKLPTNTGFCDNCGHNISGKEASKTTDHSGKYNNLNVANTKSQEDGLPRCQICGDRLPIKYVEFYANIGMLFARRQLSIRGNMCKRCINKYFWQYTFTNLFLGWWGVISFFATIFFIINNTFRYIFCITLKRDY
jgi:hypothetical protein